MNNNKEENYDLLITDREPIAYFQHAKIELWDGQLTAFKDDKTKEIIPPNSTLLLFLGAGTSISQPAAIYAASKNMYVCRACAALKISSPRIDVT